MSTPLGFNCPACGKPLIADLCDEQELVSYWGQDGPVDFECGKCGAVVMVQEHVHRSWSPGYVLDPPALGRLLVQFGSEVGEVIRAVSVEVYYEGREHFAFDVEPGEGRCVHVPLPCRIGLNRRQWTHESDLVTDEPYRLDVRATDAPGDADNGRPHHFQVKVDPMVTCSRCGKTKPAQDFPRADLMTRRCGACS